MTSESPTHPDAPRAGGETPDLLSRLRRTIARRYTHSRAHGYEPTRVSVSLADMESAIAELAELRASLLERHRDGEWESANAADLTGARWYCEHCDAWGTVEIVRLPQLDAENLVCLKCRYQVAAFIPASADPSPERAPHD